MLIFIMGTQCTYRNGIHYLKVYNLAQFIFTAPSIIPGCGTTKESTKTKQLVSTAGSIVMWQRGSNMMGINTGLEYYHSTTLAVP